MRALAVGAVLLYHAGVPMFAGGFVGVDVFFVVSGFLITGLLLKELEETKRISLAGFYARRARRILPAGLLVLTVVSMLTVFLLPRTRWESIGVEIAGSAFNFVNWLFANAAADYLRAGAAASPVQHFWTLAVEEQFYVVWPLLLVGAGYLARRGGQRRLGRRSGVPSNGRLRVLIVVAVITISVPSLAYSIHLTATNPGPAYFATTTRLYELGIGAAVALFAAHLGRIPAGVALVLGWCGLAGILTAALAYTSDTAFPGAAALLPTLGGAAVIVAGLGGRDGLGAGALLSTRLMTRVGDLSYSLYLWHWPLLVVVGDLMGGLSVPVGLAVVAFSFLPAYLSHRYVEQPVMSWSRVKPNRTALQGGLLGMVATAAVAVAMLVPMPSPVAQAQLGGGEKALDKAGGERIELYGAEAVAVDPSAGRVENAAAEFTPTVEEAADDNPRVYADGCHLKVPDTEPMDCAYGSRTSDYTVAVVGDSHAAHWVPALARLGEEENFRLLSHTKSGCPLSTEAVVGNQRGGAYDTCYEWGKNVIDSLAATKPDLVLVSSAAYRTANGGAFSDGLAGAWEELRDAGLNVAVLIDTPSPGIDIPDCVARHGADLAECAVDRVTAVDSGGGGDQRAAAKAFDDVPSIDLTRWICPEVLCSPVVGDVLVYRDDDHLTATFSRTLAPALGDALRDSGVFDPPDGT